MLAEIDLPRLGELLHALREPDGRPLRGVVHAVVVADRADHDFAGVEPHAHREAEALLEAEPARVAADLLDETERRVAGPARVVLVRDRRAEERHYAVAGELGDGALEAMHALGEEGSEALHDVVEHFRIGLLGEVHRSLHVGEEDRHLLAFAFEGGARGEDLLGEMPRRVGRGGPLGSRRGDSGQQGAAVPTEFLAGLDRRSTRPAVATESRPALRAEAPVVAVLVAARRAANPALASCGFFYSVARDVFGLSPRGPADVNGAGCRRKPARGSSAAGSRGAYAAGSEVGSRGRRPRQHSWRSVSSRSRRYGDLPSFGKPAGW